MVMTVMVKDIPLSVLTKLQIQKSKNFKKFHNYPKLPEITEAM